MRTKGVTIVADPNARSLRGVIFIFVCLIATLTLGVFGWSSLATKRLVACFERRDVSGMQLYARLGANPDAVDGSGARLLAHAAAIGDPDLVNVLIKAGAELNRNDPEEHMTPLMYSAFWGHTNVSEMLISSGADINMTSLTGETALFEAIRGKDPGMVRWLIERGISANRVNLEGHTAFCIALVRSNIQALRIWAGTDAFTTHPAQSLEIIATARRHGHTNCEAILDELEARIQRQESNPNMPTGALAK